MGAAEYKLGLEALQLAIVLPLIYVNYLRSKLEKRKLLLSAAFAFFAAHTALQIYSLTLSGFSFEIFSVFSHAFETLFFMIFGYAIVDALVADPILHRINRTNVYVVLLFLTGFSVGMVLMEGAKFAFAHTYKELVYELVEVTIQVLILNIIYHSWRDTQARHLLFSGAAFVLFLAGTLTHVYALLWGLAAMELFSLLRSALYLPALLLLAYASLFVER